MLVRIPMFPIGGFVPGAIGFAGERASALVSAGRIGGIVGGIRPGLVCGGFRGFIRAPCVPPVDGIIASMALALWCLHRFLHVLLRGFRLHPVSLANPLADCSGQLVESLR